MKLKYTLSLALILCAMSQIVQAQEIKSDTSFFANGIKVSTPDSADAFKILIFFDTSYQKVYERIYAIEGNLLEETHYSSFRLDEMDLFHREFFDNRKVHKYVGYSKGKLHGKFQVFYPNGIKRREDVYENGRWIKGTCYDSLGVEIRYIPFQSRASFMQGEIELKERIQSELSKTMNNAGNRFGQAHLGDAFITGKVIVQFMIDKNGVMSKLRVIQSPNPDINNRVINAIIKIRGWNPATENGEYVDSVITLPIVVFME